MVWDTSPISICFVLLQPDRRKWQHVFFMGAGLLWAGNLIFLIFGTSEVQPWALGPVGQVKDLIREVLGQGEVDGRGEQRENEEEEEMEDEDEGDHQQLIQ